MVVNKAQNGKIHNVWVGILMRIRLFIVSAMICDTLLPWSGLNHCFQQVEPLPGLAIGAHGWHNGGGIPPWCNGSTRAFGALGLGSSPGGGAVVIENWDRSQ